MRPGRRRPRAVIESGNPEMIEGGARGFERSHDLHGRVFVLRLEAGVHSEFAQARDGLIERPVARGDIKGGKAREQVLPAGYGLIFAACERAVARPARGLQKFADGCRPGRRRGRARKSGAGLLASIEDAREQRRVVGRFGLRRMMADGINGDLGATRTTEPNVEQRAGRCLDGGAREKRGAEQDSRRGKAQ